MGTACLAASLMLAVAWSATATPPKGKDKVPGLKLGTNNAVGEAFQVENLTIFPIYAHEQPDIGEFMTLDEALKAGKAEVREIGAASSAPVPTEAPAEESSGWGNIGRRLLSVNAANTDAPVEQAQVAAPVTEEDEAPVQEAVQGGAARVNTLVIANMSGKSILVLAGTVVVGGKQDRQVGQDFVIGPKKTVPVDAFCVEHGRWQGAREGKSTGGKFGSVNMLANQKVRAAGQYKEDQGEVWSEVSQVNADNDKEASTGTLLASLSDKEAAGRRKKLGSKLSGYLSDLKHPKKVVGLAYAVDGEVRAARWFINHHIYTKFQDTLINTMTNEAVTAQAAARSKGKKIVTTKVKVVKVKSFVEGLQKATVAKRKKTEALNENEYRESDEGYNSDCLIEHKGAPTAVTSDFLMK